MFEKLEYYRTAKTDRDGCAREWTSHPNLEDIIDKINEIIEYLNRGIEYLNGGEEVSDMEVEE